MKLSKRQKRIIISKLSRSSISYRCPLCGDNLLYKHFQSHTSKVHRGCDVKKLHTVVLQSIDSAIDEKKKNSKLVNHAVTAKDKIHIVDVSTNLAFGNQQSVKSLAIQLGWKDNPEDFLKLLQRLDVNVTTQLDVITDGAKQRLAEYFGYDSFSEYISEWHAPKNKTNQILQLEDVAKKLLIHPQTLMRKIIVEYAIKGCETLISKKIINVSNACKLEVSIVKQCLESRNISNNYELSDIEIELFLNNLKKVNWRLWRKIPEPYLPVVRRLLTDFEQRKNMKLIQKSNESQATKKSIVDKYSNSSLDELGQLYQNGNNLELDDLENDVIKELINMRLKKNANY